jgi:lipid-A-disaccharide synthase
VVASGTAPVQAAVIGTPFVVVYRVSDTTFRMAKRLVRYPVEIPAQEDEHGNLPIAMVNLIAGRRVVSELLQEHFNAEAVAVALRPLLTDTPERAAQVDALAKVRASLQSPTAHSAIERLRDAVLASIPSHTTKQ